MQGYMTIGALKALYFSKHYPVKHNDIIVMFDMFKILIKIGTAFVRYQSFNTLKQYETLTNEDLLKLVSDSSN
jgi:hypothetical protein